MLQYPYCVGVKCPEGGGEFVRLLEGRITDRCGDWRRRCFRQIEKSDDRERCTLLLLLSHILCIYASTTSTHCTCIYYIIDDIMYFTTTTIIIMRITVVMARGVVAWGFSEYDNNIIIYIMCVCGVPTYIVIFFSHHIYYYIIVIIRVYTITVPINNVHCVILRDEDRNDVDEDVCAPSSSYATPFGRDEWATGRDRNKRSCRTALPPPRRSYTLLLLLCRRTINVMPVPRGGWASVRAQGVGGRIVCVCVS